MPITTADRSPYNDTQPIRTGTFLDKLTGVSGIPRKRITEVFGDSGVGKSSLCLQIVAAAQKQSLRCLWADVEFAFDNRYALSLGVDTGDLGLLQERFAEDVLDALEKEIDAGNYDLVILDSIGGLLPRSEAEKSASEKVIGGQAGLVARFCRKVVPLLALRNVALVVINHSFTDLMSGKIMTSGGAKLAYHKSISIRLKVNPTIALKVGDKRVGKVVVAEVRKNKLASTEGMTLDARILFGEGFSKSADLLQDAIDAGVFTKTGNTYFIGETKIGMMSKLKEWAKDNENFLKEKLGV